MIKDVTGLGRCGKVELVADSLILYGNVAASTGIKADLIREYLHADPLGYVVARNEAELNNVDACLGKSDLIRGCTAGNGDYLTVVYLNLISGCTDDGGPGKCASVIFKITGKLIVTSGYYVRPE